MIAENIMPTWRRIAIHFAAATVSFELMTTHPGPVSSSLSSSPSEAGSGMWARLGMERSEKVDARDLIRVTQPGVRMRDERRGLIDENFHD